MNKFSQRRGVSGVSDSAQGPSSERKPAEQQLDPIKLPIPQQDARTLEPDFITGLVRYSPDRSSSAPQGSPIVQDAFLRDLHNDFERMRAQIAGTVEMLSKVPSESYKSLMMDNSFDPSDYWATLATPPSESGREQRPDSRPSLSLSMGQERLLQLELEINERALKRKRESLERVERLGSTYGNDVYGKIADDYRSEIEKLERKCEELRQALSGNSDPEVSPSPREPEGGDPSGSTVSSDEDSSGSIPSDWNPSKHERRGGDQRNVEDRIVPLIDPNAPVAEVSERAKACVSRLMRDQDKAKIAGPEDAKLLERALHVINPKLLALLADSNYSILAARHNVAHGIANVHGRHLGDSAVIDEASGVHSSEKKISLATYLQNGQLRVNIPTLMHEIGHAVFQLLTEKAQKNQYTLTSPEKKLLEDFGEAYKAEGEFMHRDYFRDTEQEFLAETFSMYCMKPDELRAKFPKTFACFNRLAPHTHPTDPQQSYGTLLDFQRLYHLQQSIEPVALAPGDPVDFLAHLSGVENRNAERIEKRISPESTLYFLDGEPQAIDALMERAGHDLTMIRGQRAPFNELEGLIRVTSDQLNDPSELFRNLAGTIGAVLYVPKDLNITTKDPFFSQFKSFCERNNGMCHLAIAGGRKLREDFSDFLQDNKSTLNSVDLRLSALSSAKMVELILRRSRQDSYVFTDAASERLSEMIALGGTFQDGYRIWDQIRNAYNQTSGSSASSSSESGAEQVNTITPEVLEAAGIEQAQDPLTKLETTFSLQEGAVRAVRTLIADHKEDSTTRRETPLALTFSGNPGTGKTSFARLLSQVFKKEGVVDSPHMEEVSASKLIEGGASGLRKTIEKAKNGVVFIDEFHQLNPDRNAGGRAIIDALIPILTDPEYASTVFIFGGYKSDIKELLSADQGLASRLSNQIDFRDYTTDELQKIALETFRERGLSASEEVMREVSNRITRLQNSSDYPGNARDAKKVAEAIIAAQRARIRELREDGSAEETSSEKTVIQIEDVIDKTIPTPEAVLEEIDQMVLGNDELKTFLRRVVALVNENKQRGRPLHNRVAMAIVLQGGSGTGKTTIAPLIGKLYHSLGLISNDTFQIANGAQLAGEYVGQAPGKVKEVFRGAGGGALLIDEALGLVTTGYAAEAVKQVLSELSDRAENTLTLFADYPENILQVKRFDRGLASRIKRTFTLEGLSAENAKTLLRRHASADGHQLTEELLSSSSGKFDDLVALEGFASARDIEKLYNMICEASTDDESYEIRITRAIVETCLDQMIEEIRELNSRQDVAKESGQSAPPQRTQQQTRTAEQVSSEERVSQKFSREQMLEALTKVNQQFAELANSDHEAMAEQLENSDSDFFEALAEELQVEVQVAFDERKRVLTEILEEAKEKELQFEYDCPYCGQVNSPSCGFFGSSEMMDPDNYVYSKEWLIENSRKKPY